MPTRTLTALQARSRPMIGPSIALFLMLSAGAVSPSAVAGPPSTVPQPPSAPRANLNDQFDSRLGHYIAMTFQAYSPTFMALTDWNAPLLFRYDPERAVVVVVVVGGRDTIDSAKGSLDEFLVKVMRPMCKMISTEQGLEVGDWAYEVTYVNKKNSKRMITFKDGQYALP